MTEGGDTSDTRELSDSVFSNSEDQRLREKCAFQATPDPLGVELLQRDACGRRKLAAIRRCASRVEVKRHIARVMNK